MTDYLPESVSERLTANIYEVDEEESHISIDQELAKATGAGNRHNLQIVGITNQAGEPKCHCH